MGLTISHFFFQRISLVSSFAASLFLGAYAPIDYSDGKCVGFSRSTIQQGNFPLHPHLT